MLRIQINPKSAEAIRRLIDVLRVIPVGGEIDYGTLNEAAGMQVTTGARHLLCAARDRVRDDHRIVFETVRGLGLRRLGDGDIATATGRKFVAHVRRASRRGLKALACVKDYSALTDDQKISHNLNVSLLGAMAAMASAPQVKRLREHVSNAQATLDVGRTLEAFK